MKSIGATLLSFGSHSAIVYELVTPLTNAKCSTFQRILNNFGLELRNAHSLTSVGPEAVLLAFLVALLPRESLAGCVFGANNTEDLVSRNATILRDMNDTLMSYLNSATMGIRQNLFMPAFSISNRLLKWHNVTSDNLRLFAKDGKLANLTWETETSGTYLGFNMTINQQYNDQLGIKNSTKFATLATLLERAMDTHFRSANSPFTNDFVRVNVLNASVSSDKYNTLVQAELYFLNQSRNWTEVLSRLNNLPGIPYVDGRNNNAFINVWGYSLFEIYNTPVTTQSVSESATASATETISSSTSNTSFTTTSTSHLTTSANTINATSSSSSTENTSTTTQLSNTSTSYVTESASTLTAATATSLISTANSSPNPNASTSVSSIQTHSAPTLALTQNVTTIASNDTAVTANTTPVLKETTNLLTTGISQYTVSVTASSTESATTPTHSSTNMPSAKFNGTTYDPDPRFLPVVPVIKNVYNDEILIRRNAGKFVPLTERAALYTIAIPAAIVLIIMIIGCLVCFQYCG